jgi:nitrous oxide reductase accessory protein NosL
MKRLGMKLLIIAVLFAVPALADDAKPTKKDKCPVCGMFVYKYPDWFAHIEFMDGTSVWFDGPKDAFKYYLNLRRYDPSKRASDIEYFSVTEYYELKPIDGRKAYYVLGSEVYGPMGRELVPFIRSSDAEEFMHDHNGKVVLKFEEVTRFIVKGLDR